MFATSSIRVGSHSRLTPAIHRLPALAWWLLFTSALHPILSGGLAWAAITGVGLAAPRTPLQIQRATLGSIQPIRTVERTNRDCDLNALARVMDDTYCDKYYVCSDGKYVGLFCPVGMAFDYGLQECHLKQRVDCSKRPLFFSDSLLSGTEATTSTTQTTTQTPGRMTSPPVTVTTPAPNSLPGQMTGSLMMLPFGATVTIPFGSTIFLPSGSQIQMQQQQQTVSTQEQSHQHHEQPTSAVPGHSHHHHQHRSGSASSDVVDAMNAPGNIESQSADSNTDFDYYFDDEGLSDASATPVGGQ
uniref:Chitin-binding type-2 domain-containing protein n=1 Tax=Daphnia magna TaxID=35525 RepID=A0A0N8BVU8_9CRUS